MSTSKPRKINGLFVLAATVGLIFASAGPAAATHKQVTGSGTSGTGWELGPNGTMCSSPLANGVTQAMHFSTTYYTGSHSTNYKVSDHNGTTVLAEYDGATTYNIQHGTMVAYPAGSEPASGCLTATGVPAQIPLTKATILGTARGGGVVSCQMNTTNGTYLRQNTSAITIVFNSVCAITGNTVMGSVTNVPVKHTITGTQTPCFELPAGCTNSNAGALLVTSMAITHNT